MLFVNRNYWAFCMQHFDLFLQEFARPKFDQNQNADFVIKSCNCLWPRLLNILFNENLMICIFRVCSLYKVHILIINHRQLKSLWIDFRQSIDILCDVYYADLHVLCETAYFVRIETVNAIFWTNKRKHGQRKNAGKQSRISAQIYIFNIKWGERRKKQDHQKFLWEQTHTHTHWHSHPLFGVMNIQ